MDQQSEIRLFVTVVAEGGFSPAARKLGLTPSAVSKQIGRLEDRLGVTLLTRTTRQVALTEVGQLYHERSLEILAKIDAAERAVAEFHEAPRGTVRVSLAAALCRHRIIPVLPRFWDAYPEVRVQMLLSQVYTDLVAESVDVAVRVGVLTDSTLIARKLAPHRRLPCASPAYLERCGTPREPKDLLEHDCLRVLAPTSFNRWTFATPEGPLTIRPSGRLEATSIDALYEAALRGLGIVRISTAVVEPAIREGRLVPLLEDFIADEPSSIHAVFLPRRQPSPAVRAFVDFLVEVFGADATDHPTST